MTDRKYRLRIAILVGIPLLLAALAGVVHSNTGSAALYYAAVVALGVMLIESLQEVRRGREKEAQASTALESPGGRLQSKLVESEAASDRLKSRLGEWEAENYRLRSKLTKQEQRAAEQEMELAEATNDRRLALLMRYIGETSPTAAEMTLRDPRNLDGWFDLVATRVQNASKSGYAGIVLLREALSWDNGDFVGGYEVMASGGARELGLAPEMCLPATGTVEDALLKYARVGSAYVSEFSFDDQPYWLCVFLSTSAPHTYLDTLSRAMVAAVLAVLAIAPPAPQRPHIKEPPKRRTSGA